MPLGEEYQNLIDETRGRSDAHLKSFTDQRKKDEAFLAATEARDEAKLVAEKARHYEGKSTLFEAQAVGRGFEQFHRKLGAFYAPFMNEATMEEFYREDERIAEAFEMAMDMGDVGPVRQFFAKGLREVTDMALTAAVAGTAGKAVGFAVGGAAGKAAGAMPGLYAAYGADTLSREYFANRRDGMAGGMDGAAFTTALGSAAIELGVMAAFHAAGKVLPGMGGIEESLAKQLGNLSWAGGKTPSGRRAAASVAERIIKGSFKKKLAKFSRTKAGDLASYGWEGGFEAVEEIGTSVFQAMWRAGRVPGAENEANWTDANGNVWNSPMMKTIIQTGADTLGAMSWLYGGRFSKKHGIRRFLNAPSRTNANDIAEVLLASNSITQLSDLDTKEGRIEAQRVFLDKLRGGLVEEEVLQIAEANGVIFDKGLFEDWTPNESGVPDAFGQQGGYEVLPGVVIGNDYAGAANVEQAEKQMVELHNELAKKFGYKLRILDTDQEGGFNNIEGLHVNSDKTIWITRQRVETLLKSDGNVKDNALGLYFHEFSHTLENERLYEDFYNFVLTHNGTQLKQAEAEYLSFAQAHARESGGKYKVPNADQLRKEGLARWMQLHFVKSGVLSKLAKSNMTLFERTRDYFWRKKSKWSGDKTYREVFKKIRSVVKESGAAPRGEPFKPDPGVIPSLAAEAISGGGDLDTDVTTTTVVTPQESAFEGDPPQREGGANTDSATAFLDPNVDPSLIERELSDFLNEYYPGPGKSKHRQQHLPLDSGSLPVLTNPVTGQISDRREKLSELEEEVNELTGDESLTTTERNRRIGRVKEEIKKLSSPSKEQLLYELELDKKASAALLEQERRNAGQQSEPVVEQPAVQPSGLEDVAFQTIAIDSTLNAHDKDIATGQVGGDEETDGFSFDATFSLRDEPITPQNITERNAAARRAARVAEIKYGPDSEEAKETKRMLIEVGDQTEAALDDEDRVIFDEVAEGVVDAGEQDELFNGRMDPARATGWIRAIEGMEFAESDRGIDKAAKRSDAVRRLQELYTGKPQVVRVPENQPDVAEELESLGVKTEVYEPTATNYTDAWSDKELETLIGQVGAVATELGEDYTVVPRGTELIAGIANTTIPFRLLKDNDITEGIADDIISQYYSFTPEQRDAISTLTTHLETLAPKFLEEEAKFLGATSPLDQGSMRRGVSSDPSKLAEEMLIAYADGRPGVGESISRGTREMFPEADATADLPDVRNTSVGPVKITRPGIPFSSHRIESVRDADVNVERTMEVLGLEPSPRMGEVEITSLRGERLLEELWNITSDEVPEFVQPDLSEEVEIVRAGGKVGRVPRAELVSRARKHNSAIEEALIRGGHWEDVDDNAALDALIKNTARWSKERIQELGFDRGWINPESKGLKKLFGEKLKKESLAAAEFKIQQRIEDEVGGGLQGLPELQEGDPIVINREDRLQSTGEGLVVGSVVGRHRVGDKGDFGYDVMLPDPNYDPDKLKYGPKEVSLVDVRKGSLDLKEAVLTSAQLNDLARSFWDHDVLDTKLDDALGKLLDEIGEERKEQVQDAVLLAETVAESLGWEPVKFAKLIRKYSKEFGEEKGQELLGKMTEFEVKGEAKKGVKKILAEIERAEAEQAEQAEPAAEPAAEEPATDDLEAMSKKELQAIIDGWRADGIPLPRTGNKPALRERVRQRRELEAKKKVELQEIVDAPPVPAAKSLSAGEVGDSQKSDKVKELQRQLADAEDLSVYGEEEKEREDARVQVDKLQTELDDLNAEPGGPQYSLRGLNDPETASLVETALLMKDLASRAFSKSGLSIPRSLQKIGAYDGIEEDLFIIDDEIGLLTRGPYMPRMAKWYPIIPDELRDGIFAVEQAATELAEGKVDQKTIEEIQAYAEIVAEEGTLKGVVAAKRVLASFGVQQTSKPELGGDQLVLAAEDLHAEIEKTKEDIKHTWQMIKNPPDFLFGERFNASRERELGNQIVDLSNKRDLLIKRELDLLSKLERKRREVRASSNSAFSLSDGEPTSGKAGFLEQIQATLARAIRGQDVGVSIYKEMGGDTERMSGVLLEEVMRGDMNGPVLQALRSGSKYARQGLRDALDHLIPHKNRADGKDALAGDLKISLYTGKPYRLASSLDHAYKVLGLSDVANENKATAFDTMAMGGQFSLRGPKKSGNFGRFPPIDEKIKFISDKLEGMANLQLNEPDIGESVGERMKELEKELKDLTAMKDAGEKFAPPAQHPGIQFSLRGEAAIPSQISDDKEAKKKYREMLDHYRSDIDPVSWEEVLEDADTILRTFGREHVIDRLSAYAEAGTPPDATWSALGHQIAGEVFMDSFLNPEDLAKQEIASKVCEANWMAGTAQGRALYFRRAPESPTARSLKSIGEAFFLPTERIQSQIRLLKKLGMHKAAKKKEEQWRKGGGKGKSLVGLKKFLTNGSASQIWDLTKIEDILKDPLTAERLLTDCSQYKANTPDKLFEYWRNSILSGLTTATANVLGTTVYAVYEVGLRRNVEAAIALMGNNPDLPTFDENWIVWKEMLKSAKKNAWTNCVNSWTSEAQSLTLELEKGGLNVGQSIGRFGGSSKTSIGGWEGKLIRSPQRGLLAADEWMKTCITEGYAAGFAHRTAEKHLASGELSKDQAAEFQRELLDPDKRAARIWLPAYNTALKQAWQQEMPQVGQYAVLLRQSVPGLRYIMPFIVTPMNIFRTGWNMSPLGGISTLMHWQKLREAGVPAGERMAALDEQGTKGRLSERLSENVMSGLLLSLVGLTNDEDEPWITGSNIDAPKWAGTAQGEIPKYSIRLGNKWFSYGRIEPFATAVGMTVDIGAALKKGLVDKRYMSALKAPLATLHGQVTEKTFLRGVGDLTKMITSTVEREGGQEFASYLSYLGATWVPNVFRSTLRAAQGEMPDRKIYGEEGTQWHRAVRAMARHTELPQAFGLLKDLPKVDMWGRDYPRHSSFGVAAPLGDFLYRLVIPAKVKTSHENVADHTMKAWNRMNPSQGDRWDGPPPPKRFFDDKGKKVWMDEKQYNELCRMSGKLAAQIARTLSLNPDNPTHYDREKLNSAIGDARTFVKKALFNKWHRGIDVGVPLEDAAASLKEAMIASKSRKLSQKPPTLKSLTEEERRLPMPLRLDRLEALKEELQAEKEEAMGWLQSEDVDVRHATRAFSRKRGGQRGRREIRRAYRTGGA